VIRMSTFEVLPENSRLHAVRGLAWGLALSAWCAAPVMADDTEIFSGNLRSANPNVLLVIDTSGSMDDPADDERAPFDLNTTYSGSCTSGAVYWRMDEGTEPNCNRPGERDNFFEASALACDFAATRIQSGGFAIVNGLAQWDPDTQQWVRPDSDEKTNPVECEPDAGIHGPSAGDTRRWPANVTQWTNVQADRFDFSTQFTGRPYMLYSGNYLNWLRQPAAPPAQRPTRMDVVKGAASSLVQTVAGVNLGLMRYSANGNQGDGELAAEGGMVANPIQQLTPSSRQALVDDIEALDPSGFTPLSETLFEARQYFAGGNVQFGLNSRLWPGIQDGVDGSFPSVPESRTGNTYISPAVAECQQNFIIYLTDGLPTRDNSADDEIATLIGRQCVGDGAGRCLDDLAGYMSTVDQRPNAQLRGDQFVRTFTVGFGREVQGSQLLQDTATSGGGRFFEASDSVSLTSAFNNIVSQINAVGTTFVAPTVAVNSFNRTETLSDLYVAVFEPGSSYHWNGNIKKYGFADGQIVDATGDPAINDEGFFANGSRSEWSNRTDGPNVTLGGAANELPDPATRKLFTYLGSQANLADAANDILDGNGALTDTMLGLNQPGAPTRADLINWARGADVRDIDQDPATTVRNQMGDPLHGRPALVIYGGTAEEPQGVLFAPTNDGYLHAIDIRTGEELWAFIPRELLPRLPGLMANAGSRDKQYGLDAEVRAFKTDVNGNGIVDTTDKVYLFFGMGRGGNNYYALDVTSRSAPRHQWTLGPAELPGIGQTWAAPQLARISVSDRTQNSMKLALVLSGGYDTSQDDDQSAALYNTDNIGNRLYMVDAVSGNLLWMGGGPGVNDSDRNLPLDRMNNSIPAATRVIDLDGDGFADRMYAGDTGGRVWRFDILMDADAGAAGVQVPTADQLVTGGRFATLGVGDPEAQSGDANTRRFYNAPDVALIRRRGAQPFLSVSLGSGWRGHPLNRTVQEHFYSLRDYAPFTKFSQTDAETRDADPIVIGDLADITNAVTQQVREGAAGWRLELRLPGGFTGEKVLAESRTFDNVVFFPTYLPEQATGSCAPLGRNRAYAVSVDNGSPVVDVNDDNATTEIDRYTDLAQGGIAPEISFLFPRRQPGTGPGGPGQGDPNAPTTPREPPRCTVGLEVLDGLCANLGAPVRTYWRHQP